MTSPPAYPARVKGQRVPPAWTVCPRCGAAVADKKIHLQWHAAIEDRVTQARDLLRDLSDRIAAVEAANDVGMTP